MRNSISKTVVIALFFFQHNALHSQIINIENRRFYNDTTNLVGRIKFGLTGFNNTSDIFEIGSSLNTQYKNGNNKFMIVADLHVMKSNAVKVDNTAYVHFRYNYSLSKLYAIELFCQTQYNDIIKISNRSIVGTGLRLNVVKTNKNHLFYGLGAFYEHQENNFDKILWNIVRLNTYLTYHYQVSPFIEFTNTFYYQPNVSNFSDLRIYNEFALIIDISKRFGFESGCFVLYANRHGIGIPHVIYKYDNKLTYSF